jgi:hypothetical protein
VVVRRHAIALFVVTSLAAVAFVPGLGADGEAGVTYHVQSAGVDSVRVTASFYVPNTTVEVRLPSGASDVDAPAFTQVDGESEYRLEGSTRATLTYTVSVRDQQSEYDTRNTAATDSWALFRRHRVEPDVVATGEEWTVTERYADDWRGVAGADVAYWGAYERYEQEAGGQQITLVVPAAANVSRKRVLDALTATATSLRVGARDDQVTVFVAPDPVRRGGLTSGWEVDGTQDIWVHESSSLSTPNDVWVHEYVHTRQDYVASDRVAWFREASAEYYGALFAYRQGRISIGAFKTYLRSVGKTDNATVDAPDSWQTREVPYQKGAMVAAALDARIRLASDGERSLQWVVARMNANNGVVTDDDFRRFVEEAAGRSMDDWLDRYVNGTALPTLPQAPVAYASTIDNQSVDGPWTQNRSVLNQSGPPDPLPNQSVPNSSVESRTADRVTDGTRTVQRRPG